MTPGIVIFKVMPVNNDKKRGHHTQNGQAMQIKGISTIDDPTPFFETVAPDACRPIIRKRRQKGTDKRKDYKEMT